MINLVIDLPYINPIAFQFGPLAVHWYGIMYMLSFLLGYFFLRQEIIQNRLKLSMTQLNDLLFIVCLCLLVGARIGYILFYNFEQYWRAPATIFAVWQGGMSFHGGFLGAGLGFYLFWRQLRKKYQMPINFLTITDRVLIIIPFTLALGRIGNFINAELYGRVSDLPWAMKFWSMFDYRHPVQLYEAFGHLIAGTFFFLTRKKSWPIGKRTSLFIIYYGIIRCMLEFVREPDQQIGYILQYFTMGQLLTLPLLALGIYLFKRYALPKKTDQID